MLNRREFIKKCRDISILMCGSTLLSRPLAHGFVKMSKAPPKIGFVHAQNCMGCTTSMLYGNDFDFLDFLTHVGQLAAHPALSFRQGNDYIENLERHSKSDNFLLVVEGSIPSKPKQACYLGSAPVYDVLAGYAERAQLVISSGSCASYAGIPASGGNRTGALSVSDYLKKKGVKTPVVRIPGCPAHPDHIMGSIAYTVATGKAPPLVENTERVKEYFGELLHNRCSRFQHFSQDLFVENYADDKQDCLLKKGCRGPVTFSDCPVRRWNTRTSVCIESNTPCIGCMSPQWPFENALYLETEEVQDLPWSQMKKKINQR